jgi:photosystem II stability/assembly factor-like uncharacterized protein
MNSCLHIIPGLIKRLPFLILFIAVLVPLSEPPAAQGLQVIIEDPQLHPAFSTCSSSYWYPFANSRGHTAYLTLNAYDLPDSTNHGEWHPNIPQSGYYRVEAYIAAHSSITWCAGKSRTISHDTTDARYSIHHAEGVTNRSVSQYPLSNQWLDLGEYYFNIGESGYVSLSDLNSEAEFSTSISFSAMRFTFTRLTRPHVYLPLAHLAYSYGQAHAIAGVIQAQGFDACHLPEISEMQIWWKQSPYSFYALYLGGIHLPSICSVANAAWVRAVHQQGWSFVPTWIGLQAPCSPWKYKMSSEPAISYQQGRDEAQAASAAAESMGLTNNSSGGTVIYYDMEIYGGANYECRQAAASFMNGWVERLHELGNIVGGYGAHNSYVEDWVKIANIPNDIWAASWYTNTYDSGASVNGITWLNGLWTNHQRIRQYAGDHSERWGGIKLTIDSDVADAVVAMPPSKPFANPIITTTLSIEDAGWLSADQGWLVSGKQLFWTNDQGKLWQDLSPAPVQLAYFLPSGEAWALSIQDQERLNLYRSSSWGATWEDLEIALPPDTWRPIQLQFTTPSTGWIVLQKATSQAFNYGILMKTSDGGLTWKTYNVPIAAPINFLSGEDGWMVNNNQDMVYHTSDGGQTWLAEQYEKYPLSILSLPGNATLSGWQADGLGWAVTSTGSCSGDKSSAGFACQIVTSLQQSLDGGQTWQDVSLPITNQPTQ